MEIFTIGYAGFEIEVFIKVLKEYHINSLIDVRSSPFSKFHSVAVECEPSPAPAQSENYLYDNRYY